MTRRTAFLLALPVVVFAGSLSTQAGQAPSRPAVFTAEQAEAGRAAVQNNKFGTCTDCHATGLTGRNGDPGELPLLTSLSEDRQTTLKPYKGKVPDLVGPAFRSRWGSRTTKDLTREFQERFGSPLSEEIRLSLIAYILQSNGAAPGAQPLTMSTDVRISTLVPVDPQKQ